MNKEFTRMQELAGISLNEATQIEADVEKWLEGYLKGTVLTSNDDIEKYGSLDDPKKVKYVVDGGFKTGMLDVKYSYNKEYMHIPLKDIQDLAKKIGVEDSDSYKVEDAVQNALKKKGLKQKLETSFDRSGLKVGEMMSQFFRDPNQKQPLDENFVGMGMVGNIFDHEKTDYELAFEHFTKGKMVTENIGTTLDKLLNTFEFSQKGNDEMIELANYILSPEGPKNIAMSIKNKLKGEGGEKYFTSNPEALNTLLSKLNINENFVGMGMVGNIFDREKEQYEDAFEHFLSERYEEKVEESNTTKLDKKIQSDPEFLKNLKTATKKAENGDSTELALLMMKNLEEEKVEEGIVTPQQLDLSTLKSILLRASKVGGNFHLGGQDFENKEKLKQYLSGLVDDLFNKEK